MNTIADTTCHDRTARGWFLRGLLDGVPICMGYFAVSFALGIACKNVGMDAVQATAMSAMLVASAGEFAAITLIGASASAMEMILTTIVINLRYFLMSCSLTQRLDPHMNPLHRLCLAYCITDEIFGLSVSVQGYLSPYYTYGITLLSVGGWCAGTCIGTVAGNILPVAIANALSVAMYGMFLAVIIPPGKQDRFLLGLVAVSMASSFVFSILPILKDIGSGFKTIILTILIAGIAAVIRPHVEDLTPDGSHDDAESAPASTAQETAACVHEFMSGNDVTSKEAHA